MAAGKCPKCERPVLRANLHAIDVGVPFGTTWKGVSYNCPNCGTVLSVGIDPIAIKTDIVNAIKKN